MDVKGCMVDVKGFVVLGQKSGTSWEGLRNVEYDRVAVKAVYTTATGDKESAWSEFIPIGYAY